jgi:hypothetical protein
VLAAAGHRDAAEAILFAGRDRERDEIWARQDQGLWHWLWHGLPDWLWLTVFSGVAGYGIGLYTFRVLFWVMLLTVIGAVVLWYSPNARARGLAWRLGASLHRLLPVVELNKEFKDFFENPPPAPGQVRNLSPWQTGFFSAIALAGWVLGFFLLAAMGGLTAR